MGNDMPFSQGLRQENTEINGTKRQFSGSGFNSGAASSIHRRNLS
jgi:hypothetical protein